MKENLEEKTRLGMVLDEAYGACNIISAELCKNVSELLDVTVITECKDFYVLGEHGPALSSLDVTAVSKLSQTRKQRNIQYFVGRHYEEADSTSGNSYLYAVTREDVALPVAMFSRRPGSECDFVQIGHEMTDESFIVTPQDGHSRQDIVSTLRELCARNPEQAAHQKLIGAGRYFNINKLVEGISWGHHRSSPLRPSAVHIFSKEAASALALVDICFPTPQDIPETIGVGYHASLERHQGYMWTATKKSRRHYIEAKERYETMLQDPSYESIVDICEDIDKPSQSTRLLIKEVTKRLKADGGFDNAEATEKISSLLDIDGQFDLFLGPLHETTERVVKVLGRIALDDTQSFSFRDRTTVGGEVSDVDVAVDIKRQDLARSQVRVRARPTAMADQDWAHVHTYKVDKAQPQTLKEKDIEELDGLLAKIIRQ